MIDPHAYGITVRRGEFAGERCFEARVREFPDLAEYADSFTEAYELAIDAIDTLARTFAESGRSLPPPQAVETQWSGRVTLRLPRSLHAALACAAEEEGVSLNQHLVNVLSYFSGFAAGTRSAETAVSRDGACGRQRGRVRLVAGSLDPEGAPGFGAAEPGD